MRARWVGYAVVAALVVAAVAPSVAGVASAQGAQPDTIEIDHVVQEQVEPGVVRVRTTYHVPESVVLFNVTDDRSERISITETNGFRNVSGTWVWADRSGGGSPTVTWRVRTNETGDIFGGYDTVGTGEWALFDLVTPYYRYRYGAEAPAIRTNVSLAPTTTGYVGGDLVYLGEYQTRTAQRDDQRYTVVVPENALLAPEASDVFDSLAFARQRLSVGTVTDEVVVFIAPDPLREGGVYFGTEGTDTRVASVWVSEDTPARSRTYYSEYVHTRQGYNTTARMNWLIEAQDVYYSNLLELYRGDTTFERFHASVATEENATAVLAPADRTAYKRAADYDKGGRVLAALDARIRAETARNRSLEDVWRRANDHEGPLDYDDFQRIVAAVAGQSFDDWLDRYLTTTAAPEVPDNRTLYAPVEPGIDSDGDGVPTRGELANGTNPFVAPERVDPGADDPDTDPPEEEDDDDDEPTTVDTIVVLGSLGGLLVGSTGFVVVLFARGLDRLVEWVPALLSQRSLVRLALLAIGSIATFVGYVVQFM